MATAREYTVQQLLGRQCVICKMDMKDGTVVRARGVASLQEVLLDRGPGLRRAYR